MKKINIYNINGEIAGEEFLPDELIGGAPNQDIIYYYIKSYLANQRQGTASSKTRGEVSGSGKKPWRQKGTGRARVGSIRTPLWRHGGVVFGPKPRDYRQSIPKKVKRMALKEALKYKIQADSFCLFIPENIKTPKTKIFSDFLKSTGYKGQKILFILDNDKANNTAVVKSLRNIDSVAYDFSNRLNAYSILNSDRIIADKNIFNVIKRCLGEAKNERNTV
ncbi:MAG: 50S ribosomal protein L4 [Candidatus Ratteibacteria bacterium]|nr:50S ribosomal protein L4 [Candidatus Ratteibacteria bacterium]